MSVDLVNLCSTGDNQVSKLEKFISIVNSGETSFFLNIPTGITSLTDVLFSSPVLNRYSTQAHVPSFTDEHPGGVSRHNATAAVNPFA